MLSCHRCLWLLPCLQFRKIEKAVIVPYERPDEEIRSDSRHQNAMLAKAPLVEGSSQLPKARALRKSLQYWRQRSVRGYIDTSNEKAIFEEQRAWKASKQDHGHKEGSAKHDA